MTPTLRRLRRPLALGLAGAALGGGIAYIGLPPAEANHMPADKVSAAASNVEVFTPQDGPVTLLSTQLRTSAPEDLLLAVTAECSITTNVATTGNDDQSAEGTVTVSVSVDGVQVPVTGGSDGNVVFCNRMYRRQTVNFDDVDATIRTFFDTRSANGFNWIALNVGNGIHTVEVTATLEAVATQEAFARAAVGNRTLIVEPTKMVNDADI
ncbi:MAG: hypothetical protein HYU28_03960 [Actinobacteria bacterium]|nr:hypothetical protein [Actinomycetota bacterium]